MLPKAPAELTGDWNQAGPAERQWLEGSREAFEIWRKGTERPDACYISPAALTFDVRLDVAQKLRDDFAKLAQLEAGKLEAEGDVEGASEWYLALLRSSRHCGRRGMFIERLIGIAMNNDRLHSTDALGRRPEGRCQDAPPGPRRGVRRRSGNSPDLRRPEGGIPQLPPLARRPRADAQDSRLRHDSHPAGALSRSMARAVGGRA